MTADQWIGLLGMALQTAAQIRAAAREEGVSDEQLAAVGSDYDFRIARREGEIAAPPPEQP